MTTMTVEQFKAALSDAEITSDFDCVETNTGLDENEYESAIPAMSWGWMWNVAKFGDAEITYQNTYQHPEFKPSEATNSNDVPDLWQIYGVSVVDEDGDELPRSDLYDLIEELRPEIMEIDLGILGEDKIETINDGETDMEEITIERDNAPNIKFNGEEIAAFSSSSNNASSYYSGSTGRWTELKLFKTSGGKFVCQSIGRTQWQGEHNRYAGAVCATEAEVIAFFGHGWLAKNLYSECGIEDITEVD